MPDPRPPKSAFTLSSQAVESALRSGTNAELLRDYFGDPRYEEMVALARQPVRRVTRGQAKRVLILPGIMGSTIGTPGRLWNDVIWFNPFNLVRGRATELAMQPDGTFQHQALDVVPYFYFGLRKRLEIAGYDVAYHYYDWRRSLPDLGDELVQRLQDEPSDDVYLVAHSMGGLVARAALKNAAGTAKVRRFIMLGTPNHGSFNVVQVLRGVYGITQQLDKLDPFHSAVELTEDVMNTLPSAYQMLPTRAKFSAIDLYAPNAWPGVPRIRPDLLAAAPDVQEKKLASADDRFTLIAGVNRPTITGVEKDPNNEFVYLVADQGGDGTVPLDLAEMANVPTYPIDEEHTDLPNNATVAEMVKDVIESGASRSRTPVSRGGLGAVRRVPAAGFVAPVRFGSRAGDRLTAADHRAMLASVFGAGNIPAPAEAPPRLAAPAAVEAVDLSFAGGVFVGRRKQQRLEIVLAHGSLVDVQAKAYVVGLFPNVVATGAAKALDGQLGGLIRELENRRMFNAGVGQIFMLPNADRRLPADVIVFVGLGHYDQFTDDVQQVAAENVVRTLSRARFDELATVLFGASSVSDTAHTLFHVLTGFLAGLRGTSAQFPFRRLILCEIDDGRYREMKQELYRLAGTGMFAEVEVMFDEWALPPVVEPSRVALRRLEGPVPAYLYARGTQSEDRTTFDLTLMAPGGAAAVIPGRQTFITAELNALLKKLDDQRFDLDAFADALTKLILPEGFREALVTERLKEAHLTVVHDAEASRIPWETLKLGGDYPCLAGGISRRYIANNLSIAKWSEQRRMGSTLNVLAVVNPTRDLDGAEDEGRRIQEILANVPNVTLAVVHGATATKSRLLAEFTSGNYDVIHYAGHAEFNASQPGRSGILCAGYEPLTGDDLASLRSLPALAVFNACESGRTRRRGRRTEKPAAARLIESTSFAEAFLRGGIAQYVGTYWPVGDAGAVSFADAFYRQLVAGKAVGQAVLDGRHAVKRANSYDWADYIHFGDRDFAVKPGP
jgi:pimeloyl-ACP methyl ester carboxylesterase